VERQGAPSAHFESKGSHGHNSDAIRELRQGTVDDCNTEQMDRQRGAAGRRSEESAPPLARLDQPDFEVRASAGEDEARETGSGSQIDQAAATLGEPGEGAQRLGIVPLEELRHGARTDQVDSGSPARQLVVVRLETFDNRRRQGLSPASRGETLGKGGEGEGGKLHAGPL
jgi:hypothetical protein